MTNAVKYIHREKSDLTSSDVSLFSHDAVISAKIFHESFPNYSPTPLVSLNALSARLGVKNIFVKDESYRFGLNAFKSLGASYAIGRFIAKRVGLDTADLTYSKLTSQAVKDKLGSLTFVTATDGNHGRAVAWAAKLLGQRAVVYMPKGSCRERFEAIKALGADVTITDLNYDDAVRLANKTAEENGWVTVQDTAWDGYEEIPTYIMQGYTTIAQESCNQLCGVKPTHIFLQAGVGAFAGAMIGYFANEYKDSLPIFTVVEPNAADCCYQSALANDGDRRFVKGDMNTIMAGLACGEPNTIAWKIINAYADNFISLPDEAAARAMRVLGNPLAGDERIISGESGGAGIAAFYAAMTQKELADLKHKLRIDNNSVLLFVNTEGNTDEENYRKIVWC